MRYWRRHAALRAAQALDTLVSLVRNVRRERCRRRCGTKSTRVRDEAGARERWTQQVAQVLADRLHEAAGIVGQRPGPSEPGLSAVESVGDCAAHGSGFAAVARACRRSPSRSMRRPRTETIAMWWPTCRRWATSGSKAARPTSPPRRPAQCWPQGHRVFNEFFEAHISPTTGALQSFDAYEQRGNRLSQQLALRMPPASRRAGRSGHLLGHGRRQRQGQRGHQRPWGRSRPSGGC